MKSLRWSLKGMLRKGNKDVSSLFDTWVKDAETEKERAQRKKFADKLAKKSSIETWGSWAKDWKKASSASSDPVEEYAHELLEEEFLKSIESVQPVEGEDLCDSESSSFDEPVLVIKCSIDQPYPLIKSLPTSVAILGDVDFEGWTSLIELPAMFGVAGNASIVDCRKLEKLPSSFVVGGSLKLQGLRKAQSPEHMRWKVFGHIALVELEEMKKLDGDLCVDGSVLINECPNLAEMTCTLRSARKDVEKNAVQLVSISQCASLERLPATVVANAGLELVELESLQLLPESLYVGGNISIESCASLEKIPANFHAGKDVNINQCDNLEGFEGESLSIGGSFRIWGCISLSSMPSTLQVANNLDISRCKRVKHLPTHLDVGGSLMLQKIPISSFPSDVSVGGDFVVSDCDDLKIIGKGLRVGGAFRLRSCPAFEDFDGAISVKGSVVLAGLGKVACLPSINPEPSLGNISRIFGTLTISECSALEAMPAHIEIETDLIVEDCASLHSFPESLAVNNLTLKDCPVLVKLGDELCVRNKITIRNCNAVESIPPGVSVKVLNMSGCESIVSLPKDLVVHHSLDMSNCTSLRVLPERGGFEGDISLKGCTALTELPEGWNSFGGICDLSGCTSLKLLPSNIKTDFSVFLNGCTSLGHLPKQLSVGGHLDISGCDLLEFVPDGAYIRGDFRANDCKSLEELGENIKCGGSISLVRSTALRRIPYITFDGALDVSKCTSLKELAAGLHVNGAFLLSGCSSLTTLPENLTVAGTLIGNNTGLVSIPKTLAVSGDCNLSNNNLLMWILAGTRFLSNTDFSECRMLESFPEDVHVCGNLSLDRCQSLQNVGDRLHVEGDFKVNQCRQLVKLGEDIKVDRRLTATESPALLAVPKGLSVGENADFQGSHALTTVEENVRVKKNLILTYCRALTTLPADLSVGQDLLLNRCLTLSSVPLEYLQWGPATSGLHTLDLTGCRLSDEFRNTIGRSNPANVQIYVDTTTEEELDGLWSSRQLARVYTPEKLKELVEFWCAAADMPGLVKPEDVLSKVPSASVHKVCKFFSRLHDAREFRTDGRLVLCKRVVDIFLLLTSNDLDPITHAEVIQRMEDSVDACADKPIWGLNQMEIAVRISKARGNREALRKLGLGILRLGIVHEHCRKKISNLRVVDDVCVYLRFEIEMRKPLDLPISASAMHFPDYMNITHKDFDACKKEALGIKDKQLDEWLDQWPEWHRQARYELKQTLVWDELENEEAVENLSSYCNLFGDPIEDPIAVFGDVFSMEELLEHWVRTGRNFGNMPWDIKDVPKIKRAITPEEAKDPNRKKGKSKGKSKGKK